jgi:hypothetical protein
MGRRLSDLEKAEVASLAHMWESSKHRNADVTITVLDETDDSGRPVYDVQIRARAHLPAAATQLPLSI